MKYRIKVTTDEVNGKRYEAQYQIDDALSWFNIVSKGFDCLVESEDKARLQIESDKKYRKDQELITKTKEVTFINVE